MAERLRGRHARACCIGTIPEGSVRLSASIEEKKERSMVQSVVMRVTVILTNAICYRAVAYTSGSSASLNRLLLSDRKQNPSLEIDGNPAERARQEKQCIHCYRAAHPLPQGIYRYRALEQSEASAASMTAWRIFQWQHDSCSMWLHIKPHRRE